MLDLGRSFHATLERSPEAMAIVDGDERLSYAAFGERIGAAVGGLDRLGLKRGDRLVTVLQNRLEMATLHWACQIAGVVVTPLNWRVKADELDYCLEDAEARAVVFQDVSDAAVAESASARRLARIGLMESRAATAGYAEVFGGSAPLPPPRAAADDISLMLYTSGTTGKPKGVPRRHRAERAAAVAHVAQNLYGVGERTLGVMPLYHTMGVRSLLAMALIDGLFACLPRFDVPAALALIARERLTNLYLVPTLYHDLIHHPAFAGKDVSTVRKLGFAGAAMTDGLLQKLEAAFKPDLFVNHYGSSEVYTFTIDQAAPRKPGSAGRAGINQHIRVVKLGAASPEERAAPGEEGEIVASLASDEAFEGYWKRPDADAKAIRQGWYFTGDTGYVDGAGDLFVTGRVDDMIITGGENVSPGEIENVLSLHPAVAEVAIAGLPDERWGKRVVAFIKRSEWVDAATLDQYCRSSGLANFKRPREFVFVEAIPKSPVGKILRRELVAGAYQIEINAKRGDTK
jgi:2-furoate---CoA ligase